MDLRPLDRACDLHHVERLWLEYLTWGNDALHETYGFRLPVREAVDHDLATLDKFQPPDGRLLLAFHDDVPVGVGCLRRIGEDTGEIKRMYVQPAHRRGGLGRGLLDALLAAARDIGYRRLRLDSPIFLTAAHALYRSREFVDIAPYAESGIPDRYNSNWVFMERAL
jgi:GNAT superfamily N-acetyltransferase